MKTDQEEEDRLVGEVRRQVARAQREREMSFWQGMGIIGSIGWMVVVPTLLGIALGRWLDTRFDAGIFWTLSLLMAGLVIGCAGAWKHVEEVRKS